MRVKISRSWDTDIMLYSEILNKYKLETKKVDEYYTYHTIEISSLEELLKLRQELTEDIILTFEDDCNISLEIYDTWRE